MDHNPEKKKGRLSLYLERLDRQLRHNRKSFVVFSLLRTLVIVSMVRQFFMHNYESVMLCILTLILLVIPGTLQIWYKIRIPQTLEIIVYLFIYAAEILGEVNQYYTRVPHWDTMLHTLNGFLAAAIGFSLVLLLNWNSRFLFDLSPIYLVIVAFCFSMTIGVVWEIFEFTMDMFFGLDMQKDTIVHSISTIMLSPKGKQIPVAIRNITEVSVNGQDLGLGGYLDIGIIDTMKDLIVNFIGAAVFSVLGYFALKGDRKQIRRVARFTVTPDYEKQEPEGPEEMAQRSDPDDKTEI